MNWSATAAVLLGLAVGLGAFGAHGLKGRLDDYSLGVYEKAVLYHFFHALGPIDRFDSAACRRNFAIRRDMGVLVAFGRNTLVLGEPVCAGINRSESFGSRRPFGRIGVSGCVVPAGLLVGSQVTRRELGRIALGSALGAKLLSSPRSACATVLPQPPGIKLGSVAPANPTDDDLLFFRQLGVDCVFCAVTPELNSVEGLLRIRKRYADAGLSVHNIRNLAVTNNQLEIVLNRPGRARRSKTTRPGCGRWARRFSFHVVKLQSGADRDQFLCRHARVEDAGF